MDDKLNVQSLGEPTLTELDESEQKVIYAQMLARVLELRKQQLIEATKKQDV